MATYAIVGGVAGGATAAARLRRLSEDAEIIVLERGPYVSFANCGLPYAIGGTIRNREALLVSTPEKLEAEFNLDVRTRHEAIAIRPSEHEVDVRDLESGSTYTIAYHKLLLSPGAKPFAPPIPGIDLPGVLTLRTIPDMNRIKEHIQQVKVQEAIVVGGGFIGLEMAENLRHLGLKVTIIELLPQVMTALDFEMAAMLHDELVDNGVSLLLNDGLARIEQTGDRLEAITASGRRESGDMVLLALGVRPESDLARDASLALGPRGHIIVDERMRTSSRDIYAVGDAVQTYHRVTGKPCAIPLAGPANRQARCAADNMAGRDSAYPGTLGTSIVKVFGRTAACTGANSHMLTRESIPFLSHMVHAHDHVTYYPGATPMTIKLLFSPEGGKLLGAQVVGANGVDRTIGVLATALASEMSVFDLQELELAYAPPYGAAKDPVNIAGFAATNRLIGDSEVVTWKQLRDNGHDYGVLDVRTEPEWELGHIDGAVHISQEEIRERIAELDPSKTWVSVCKVGRRAYVVERILRHKGLRAATLAGGWDTYTAATRSVTSGEPGIANISSDSFEPAHETLRSPELASPASDTIVELDACGLQCPGPIMAVYQRMQTLEPGAILQVSATDPGFRRDVAAWCERTGNTLLGIETDDGRIVTRLQKGSPSQAAATFPAPVANAKTMVVFSGELDRALAAFVIANGAAAMGQQVTMFFTFWGLNVLRRRDTPPVAKSLIERMFGWMLPRGADRLKLSKLNMGGLGTAMIKGVMRSKRIDSLPALMAKAREQGVRLIACQMSMDMMGIKAEELVEGVEIGGVATFINESDKGNASLFI